MRYAIFLIVLFFACAPTAQAQSRKESVTVHVMVERTMEDGSWDSFNSITEIRSYMDSLVPEGALGTMPVILSQHYGFKRGVEDGVLELYVPTRDWQQVEVYLFPLVIKDLLQGDPENEEMSAKISPSQTWKDQSVIRVRKTLYHGAYVLVVRDTTTGLYTMVGVDTDLH